MRYNTIIGQSEGFFRSRGSKFHGYATRLDDESDADVYLQRLRGTHPKARHWCYAYRIGSTPDRYRANDDGEPNNVAGRPILGQIDASGLTNLLVVVVRYFGGTKLGVPGLIEAYRTAAAEAIAAAKRVEGIVERHVCIATDYAHLAPLMQAIKVAPWRTVDQTLDANVRVRVAAPADEFEEAFARLWRVLAEAYPGEEELNRSPAGYDLSVIA